MLYWAFWIAVVLVSWFIISETRKKCWVSV
jgi:hypothetical protein